MMLHDTPSASLLSASTLASSCERAIAEGFGCLGDADLLAILLETGPAGRPIALISAALLDRYGGLAGLARLTPTALAQQPGVGMTQALRVGAALELGVRATRPSQSGPLVSNSSDVAAHLAPTLATLQHEELWLLCLNGRNQVRSKRRVAQGGVHGLMVRASDVLRAALFEAATAILLVHNHPSGDPTPSPEDLYLSQVIADAGKVVGIPLVDHVIVAPSGRYSSLLDLGILEPTEAQRSA